MLIAGSTTSLYDDYYRSMRYLGYSGKAVVRVYNDANEIQDGMAGITSDQIYTNFGEQKIITGNFFSNSLYAKEEPLTKIDWTILSQTKKILDQDCQMATAEFKGRHYTAWFAPAIPLNAGPWKLHGLPGIILAANDGNNEVSFTCTKISLPEKNAPALKIPKNVKLINAEKYEKAKRAFEKDPMAGKALTNDPGSYLSVIGVAPGAVTTPVKPKPRSMNNPIEKK
jgi:GLPGLI family protein